MEAIRCRNCGQLMTNETNNEMWRCPNCMTLHSFVEKISFHDAFDDILTLGEPCIQVLKRDGSRDKKE